jgi:hypothetical protein
MTLDTNAITHSSTGEKRATDQAVRGFYEFLAHWEP